MDYQKEQSDYQNWAKNTSPQEQEMLCGSNHISENEKYFIEKYAKNNCIDIGCGTGNRTFKEYERKGINYVGIEQFEHLKKYSQFPAKIQIKDITSDSFQLDGIGNKKFDIAFYFGGVINGFVSTNARLIGWGNIEQVAKKYANYILFDTLSHFSWFRDENKEKGEVIQLFPTAPPQYFYSLKELKTLFAKHYLEIVEEKEEPAYHFRRTHFLLKYVGE
jgi:SAM-dependent methyltransferase